MKTAVRSLTKLPVMHRMIDAALTPVERAEGEPEDGPKKYRVTFSTETPYTRSPWWSDPYVEVLGHTKAEVRLGRLQDSGPVLLEHFRFDHVGAIDLAEIDEKEKRGIADIRFSRNPLGEQTERDVVDRIKTKMSVGYIVHAMERTKRGDPEKEEWDEYRVTDWEPIEISVVAMPADMNATIGRSETGQDEKRSYPVVIRDGESVTEETRSMSVKNGEPVQGNGTAPAAEAPAATVTVAERGADLKAERERAAAIIQVCRAHRLEDQAAKFIESGMPVEAVKSTILDGMESQGRPQGGRERTHLEVPKEVRKKYSYARALNAAVALKEGRANALDGVEAEVHQELKKHVPANQGLRGGVILPLTMLDAEQLEMLASRALQSNVGGKGSELVQEVAGDFLPQLQNRTVLIRRGATVLTGLERPIAFAKQTGGMTFYWKGENTGPVTASDITLGLSLLTPRTIMGKGSVSRQLLMMSNPSVEAMIRREMAGGHGRAIDRVGIHGTGAGGEPQGIYKTPGVSVTTSFGAPSTAFGKLIDMQATVSDKNADDGALGFITTPLLAGKYRQTLQVTGIPGFIWEGSQREGVVAGEAASATGQVSKTMTGTDATGGTNHGLIYGNFADVIFGSWAGFEIIVDEITQADEAMVKFISFGMEDVMLRYPEAFVVADGATL